MSILHLRKLAQGAINYLTHIFILSISTGQIPGIWHKAIIIPILKPGSDINIGMNWQYTDTHPFPSCSTWLSADNTRHALHCRRSPPNIKLVMYSDSITIYTSGLVVADLINVHSIYLSQVLNYVNNNSLKVSTGNSTVTLFTPDDHEHFHKCSYTTVYYRSKSSQKC